MRKERYQFSRIWLAVVLALLLGMAMNLNIRPVLAHGDAILTVAPSVVAPGGVIQVKGEGVEAGEEFTISLEGMNFQATLGTVTVGDDEDFHQDFTVPAGTPAGSYQVVAISGEGEKLTAELTVQVGAVAAEPVAPAEGSAELMRLDRSKPAGQLAIIAVGLLASIGLGLVLVRAR